MPSPNAPRPTRVPWRELDSNIVSLVRALTRYPGVTTLGSCGGHETTSNPSQWPTGSWYVTFTLPQSRQGWLVLEHLAWAITHDYMRAGHKIVFQPDALPPFLNTPGRMLRFSLEGFQGEDPDELAVFLISMQDYLVPQAYVPGRPILHKRPRRP